MNKPIIEVKNLIKRFKGKLVLDHINIKINKGEIFGLLGTNGAGKTTLIHAILGLVLPDSGNIFVFNKEIQHNLTEIHKKTNFASSYSRLQDQLTVMQNLDLFAGLYSIKDSKKTIFQLMNFFQLNKYIYSKTKVISLSSGEQTRLLLCKCLLNNPDILFLDEPTANLDPIIAHKVIKYMRKLSGKHSKTIVYASHNLSEIKHLCHRVALLKNGKISKIIVINKQTSESKLLKLY